MKKLAILALVTTLATGALAHSSMDNTTPKNGATIVQVPAEISFNFAKDIRLTRVDMLHQNDPSVRLNLGDQKSFDRVFSLPVENMGDGIYLIKWRGLGKDGHAVQGEFSFTVQ